MKRTMVLIGGLLSLVGCGGTTPTPAETCNAANCAGCCLNGACQAGTAASGCGKSGGACVACQTHQICKTDQTCGVDLTTSWKVIPLSAKIAATNNGTAWDTDNSAADPYVTLVCPPVGTKTVPDFKSAIVQDSLTPTWNAGGCVAKASDLVKDGFVFQVFDSDLVTDDTVTQVYKFPLTEDAFIPGQELYTTAANGALDSIRFRFEKQ